MIKLLQSSHKMNSSKASRKLTFRLPDSDVTLNDTFILVMHSETEGKRESLVFRNQQWSLVCVWSDFEVIHPGLVVAVST